MDFFLSFFGHIDLTTISATKMRIWINDMKITKHAKILKKSHIWLKNEKVSYRKYETFAKICHFWLFWTHFIYPVICCRYWYEAEKTKMEIKHQNMAFLEFFSCFCVIFGFLLPYPYPHQHSGHKKIFTSKSWYGPP